MGVWDYTGIRDFEGKDPDGVGIGSSDAGGVDIAENVVGVAQSQTLWSFFKLMSIFSYTITAIFTEFYAVNPEQVSGFCNI